MVVVIGGKNYWLWRAVDGEGEVLEFWSNLEEIEELPCGYSKSSFASK